MDLGAGPLAAINPGNERCLTVTHGHVLEDKGQAGACPDRTRARDRRAPECRFMAHLLITDDAVTIDMSRGERFEAAHAGAAQVSQEIAAAAQRFEGVDDGLSNTQLASTRRSTNSARNS